MIAALIQASPPDEARRILDAVSDWVGLASGRGAELIVFPELFYPGFGILEKDERQFVDLSHPASGSLTNVVAEIAKQYGVHVVFTFLEHDEGLLYNAAALFDHRGTVLHVHRKTMLTPGMESLLSRGNSYRVVDTELGRIGLLICADATCPEGPRVLALQDPAVLCLSSGDFVSPWKINGKDIVSVIWEACSAAPCRAVENVVYWLAANPSGRQGSLEFFGGSRVISPLGEIIASAPQSIDAPSIVQATLDLGLIDRVKAAFPIRERRRPELYGSLAGLEE